MQHHARAGWLGYAIYLTWHISESPLTTPIISIGANRPAQHNGPFSNLGVVQNRGAQFVMTFMDRGPFQEGVDPLSDVEIEQGECSWSGRIYTVTPASRRSEYEANLVCIDERIAESGGIALSSCA